MPENSVSDVGQAVSPEAVGSAASKRLIDAIDDTTNGGVGKQGLDAVVGITPEQVVQELKKSGYVDQLRRQMFDAFTAASTAPTQSATPHPTVTPPASRSQTTLETTTATVDGTSALSIPAQTAAPSIQSLSETSSPSTLTTESLPTANSTLDIGSKAAFLQFLAAPLRAQVVKEHDTLRFEDSRGQQSKLLKLLESESVDYPDRESSGDATLFDLLIRHLTVSGANNGFTSGMLSRDGKIGKEAFQKIADTVGEMVNPTSKDADEDEDDDEDVDEEDAHDRVPHSQTSASNGQEN